MAGNKRSIGSDLAKVDAYVNTAADYEELPELDDAFFVRATFHPGGEPVLGPLPLGATSEEVTLRLDPHVIAAFKATGPDWRARMNDVLAAAAKRLNEV